jgi:hypothetical protein
MPKTKDITVKYSDQKLEAINIVLEMQGVTLASKILKTIDETYTQNVTHDVQVYIAKRLGEPTPAPPQTRKRQAKR